MKTNLLERKRVSPETFPDFDDYESGDLGLAARNLLSYHRLFEDQAKIRKNKSLLQTFDELDIRPFTHSSVEAYKESCEWSANPRLVNVAEVGFGVSFVAGFVALIVLVVAALIGYVNVAFCAAVLLLTKTIVGTVCVFVFSRYARSRKWSMHELSSYAEPIPEFALQTAVDIKHSHPDVQFFVCALKEERIVVDPFLVLRVKFGDEVKDYYLEVWNESKFSGEREA